MTMQKPSWWEWIDHDALINEPLRLLEDAPDEEKQKFKEWQKKAAEDTKCAQI